MSEGLQNGENIANVCRERNVQFAQIGRNSSNSTDV